MIILQSGDGCHDPSQVVTSEMVDDGIKMRRLLDSQLLLLLPLCQHDVPFLMLLSLLMIPIDYPHALRACE